MLPMFADENDKAPKWFDDALLYIQNRLAKERRSHYLFPDVAVALCKEAAKYGLYILWYECGFEHIVDNRRRYEGRESWVNSYAGFGEITTAEEAEKCNQAALELILVDIKEGYTGFCVYLGSIHCED